MDETTRRTNGMHPTRPTARVGTGAKWHDAFSSNSS